MTVFTKVLLSGSTNGRPIKVAAVATPGTLIHTAVAGTVSIDEVWLYACNTDVVARLVTVEFGGVTDPDDLIEIEVPSQSGLYTLTPGMPLQNGLVVGAFAAVANVITIVGFVNRIS